MPFQALIKLYLVLTFHHICSANIRKRETDDAKLASKRFIFDANHKFTGWASWEQYAACSTLCVSGYEQQTKECCDTGDNRLCYNIPWDNLRSHIGTCPVDGHFGSWSSWSPCSTTCGNGIKYRTRDCEFDINAPRGKNCTGDFIENQPCSQRSCPVDGIWNTWSPWCLCSATCGGGSMDRHRDCFFAPHVPQGDNCAGVSKQSQNCNNILCPVDGVFGPWNTWTKCTVTCGSGTQERRRTCRFDPAAPHGMPCSGNFNQSRSCNTQMCPVDGHFGSWSSWTPCSTTCGHGIMYRTRHCEFDINAPRGKNCTGDFIESQPCNQRSCPVDGIWNTWSRWSACSASCGGGSMDRHRDCFFAPHVPQGDYCAGISKQSQNCNSDLCPVDGVWTFWSAWTTCSATCGSGTMSRHRECRFQPHVPQGAFCRGTAVQSQSCNNISCPAPNPRSCYQCLGPVVICEKLNAPQVCPLDKPFCINTLNNFRNASRSVEMRCGTRDECQRGWYDTYRNDDKCTKFSQDFIYTNDFSCEFCCNTDNCNEKVNPDTKWQP